MQQGFAFIPMVAETSDGWGPSASCVFKAFAKSIDTRSDGDAAHILQEKLQVLCTAIRRANARAVLRRAPEASSGSWDC